MGILETTHAATSVIFRFNTRFVHHDISKLSQRMTRINEIRTRQTQQGEGDSHKTDKVANPLSTDVMRAAIRHELTRRSCVSATRKARFMDQKAVGARNCHLMTRHFGTTLSRVSCHCEP